MIRVMVATATLILSTGLSLAVTTPAIAATIPDGVCAELDSGKTDVVGERVTVTVNAPDGFLIDSYCVKAGSAKQGEGPEYFDVDPVAVLTFGHTSGKDVSHWSVGYVPVVPVVVPPVEVVPVVVPPVEVPPTDLPPAEDPPEPAEDDYTPPVLDCESWQLPGWLNEHGDPSGCVENLPCPWTRDGLPCPADIPAPAPVAADPVVASEDAVTPPTEVEPTEVQSELALTGTPDPLQLGAVAVALLAIGGLLVTRRRSQA